VKYAFVVPRYGLEVVGGAELGARMFSERLVRELGWSVEVFTTCARDHMTWANEYAEGEEVLNGVVVRRFRTTGGRPPRFFSFSERLLSAPRAATLAEADEFVELQGPACPALFDALAESDRDLFAFYPYLYTTTVRGLSRVTGRAVLHPAAHDEPALHLPVFRAPFGAASGLVFHTCGEQRLVNRIFSVAHVPQAVVGLGLDGPPEPAGHDAPSGAPAGLGGRPYWLSLGRVDGFKGTTMLGAFFAAYKQRHPGPLALVIAGPVTAPPPSHPDVIVTGPVDEADKWALLGGAEVFVQPSPHESFSIVLMEAWSRGLPAVVNARCAATREHCARSGGGVWFDSYAEFEAVVSRLDADRTLRRTLGERGRAFVDANFRWPALIERYRAFLEGVRRRTPMHAG
jgi:glycosyltransferase involved in cell wall biosynthesis